MSSIMIIIIGMMVVTYIPRVMPFYTLHGKALPKQLKRFLEYVPYAALGALIIPGALDSIPNHPLAIIIGLFVAFLYSWVKGGIIVSVVGSMVAAFLVLTVGG